jgi:hypothetical protein
LLSAPILIHFTPGAYTEIHTDASNLGFGAVLMQKGTTGVIHLVEYASKSLSTAEK